MATQREAEKAVEKHAERLSVLPNVVGLGVQPLSDEDEDPGRMAVAVYVSRKVPLPKLKPAERVPRRVKLIVRGRTQYVPTRVIEQGEVTLE